MDAERLQEAFDYIKQRPHEMVEYVMDPVTSTVEVEWSNSTLYRLVSEKLESVGWHLWPVMPHTEVLLKYYAKGARIPSKDIGGVCDFKDRNMYVRTVRADGSPLSYIAFHTVISHELGHYLLQHRTPERVLAQPYMREVCEITVETAAAMYTYARLTPYVYVQTMLENSRQYVWGWSTPLGLKRMQKLLDNAEWQDQLWRIVECLADFKV